MQFIAAQKREVQAESRDHREAKYGRGYFAAGDIDVGIRPNWVSDESAWIVISKKLSLSTLEEGTLSRRTGKKRGHPES